MYPNNLILSNNSICANNRYNYTEWQRKQNLIGGKKTDGKMLKKNIKIINSYNFLSREHTYSVK